MAKKSQGKTGKPVGSNAAEELSALNVETDRRREPGQRLRRRMEASIEVEAKERRKREAARKG